MPLVADPGAISFMAEHGGILYLYVDDSGRKHVETEAPSDPSVRFEQVRADGFLMYVEQGIEHPELGT